MSVIQYMLLINFVRNFISLILRIIFLCYTQNLYGFKMDYSKNNQSFSHTKRFHNFEDSLSVPL